MVGKVIDALVIPIFTYPKDFMGQETMFCENHEIRVKSSQSLHHPNLPVGQGNQAVGKKIALFSGTIIAKIFRNHAPLIDKFVSLRISRFSHHNVGLGSFIRQRNCRDLENVV